ncbi:Membrane-bound lytic murein transglycosylase D [Saliniradius amylolyticus]|uniref:Membrane-bound lytic murein transglycosylase D n=1 Tax=Saliniradius amylolyticus TaxID=2183582 RepID=A0A2S2E1M6_9ALTE|nr:LysM peptidoglycan-binding domain-containing protein [Saliniradius amylolyticus]AWL11538.1 Membrane-bound lytic murein transglycosylase D [Saliniradius amylolyticus]
MKKLLLTFSAGLLLQGCQTTSLWSETQQQKAEEQNIAADVRAECSSVHPAEEAELCRSGQEGVIPVKHPVDELLAPIDPLPEAKQDETEPKVTDLWQRIRSQLAFEVPDNRRVNVQRNWYLKHPEYMERVSKRAAPFLYLIVEELEAAGMPLELTLLPIVESAFDPFAYSHGRAAGMWQFIPGTGKRFGLRQSWWYDGRRDVLASTRAAIKYMQYLHDFFDGNWLHALASYNSGEGRVRNAIRKNRRLGKPTDFWSLELPRETRAYVPKLLALADILKNSEALGAKWLPIKNEPVTQPVNVGSQIDLALAAEMAGLSVEELHALNPGYNRWATDPKGPHTLLLPIDKAEPFELALTEMEDRERLNWVRHKVESGDSLLKLAKEYHTSVDVIRQVNDIRGNIIRAGDHLMVPVALKALDSYSLSKDQRLASTQSRRRAEHKLTHRVQSGDTLWELSMEYDVNVRKLASWNGMAPTDPLMPGQKLVIWVDKVSEQQSSDAIMRTVTYRVRNGDSLARIANRFNVSISDIEKWNQISRKNYLQPGQRLKLHIDVTRT